MHAGEVSKAKLLIYEAAVKLFSEQGFSGTTMRDIAAEVNLLPGSLYAHIKSKDELLSEIVQAGIQDFLLIEETVTSSGASPDKKLRQMIQSHIELIASDPDKILIVIHQWRFLKGRQRKLAVEMRRQYALVLRGLIVEGVESGVFKSGSDLNMQVYSILGAINWVPEWFQRGGSLSAKILAENIADIFLDGMLK